MTSRGSISSTRWGREISTPPASSAGRSLALFCSSGPWTTTIHLTIDQELDAVLSAFGAERLVIGHTPDLKGIEFLSGGRLARIDTGISRAYGGPLTWLEIAGGTMVPHTVGRLAQ